MSAEKHVAGRMRRVRVSFHHDLEAELNADGLVEIGTRGVFVPLASIIEQLRDAWRVHFDDAPPTARLYSVPWEAGEVETGP